MVNQRSECRAPTVILTLVCLLGCVGTAAAEDSVESLFGQAQAARARGDLATAEQKYLEVIRRAPQFSNAYHNLGIVLFMEKKYEEAVKALGNALRFAPQSEGAHAMLGLAYYQLYELSKAEVELKAALRLNPDDGTAQLYLAKAKLQQHDYQAAASILEKLAAKDPSNVEVLYDLSLAHLKLMVADVNRFQHLAPNSYQFHLILAEDAMERADYAEATKEYLQALRVKPDVAGVHYALGNAYKASGKANEAAVEFKKELQLNPNDPLSLWKLGELTLSTDRVQSREYLQRAVGIAPDLPQARLAYGRVLVQDGETEKALEQFEWVVKLAPEEDSVHYQLANLYRRMGRDHEARVEMRRFQELARRKSEQRERQAEEVIEMGAAGEAPANLEPGFSPSREPARP